MLPNFYLPSGYQPSKVQWVSILPHLAEALKALKKKKLW